MNKVRVLVADDHAFIVDALRQALDAKGVAVVGVAGSAEEAVNLYQSLQPDVALLDVAFGDATNGLEAARAILGAHPDAKIIFFTQYHQGEVVQEAYRLGGKGFVTKNDSTDVLVKAIHEVFAGKVHFLPQIAERLALMQLRGDDSPRYKLDARELDVFRRLAMGQTNEEIAEALDLSTKTVSQIVQSVKGKLGVHRPAEITRLAIRHRIIES